MSALAVLFILWLYFALSVVGGVLFGKVLAYGSPGGGRGYGHLCDRRTDAGTFFTMMLLYAAITVLLLVATDAFGQISGLAEAVGFGQPLQDREG